jgi:Adenomatosis polyposis coli down-regulated 1
MTLDQTKQFIQGQWVSIAPEVRPGSQKNADGSLKPFYLTRAFKYSSDNTFELEIINFADAYGKAPLAKIVIEGNIVWQGEHPIIAGAQKVKFTADKSYGVTPLHQGFADALNQLANKGFNKWEVNRKQSILGKAFIPFGLAEGQIFAEYDLIYVHDNMLFWGARNIDGRGFDKEENRPINLQIPLVRQTNAT